LQDRARARNHFWTIAAGGLAAIALLGVTLTRMSEGFDRVSLEREQVVVDNGLSYRFEEIGRSLVPLVVWDDAVVHLDNRFDRAWTRDNIGTFLQVTEGFQFSWVLDADDRPIYGMDGGQEADLSSFGALARSTSSIVSRVRQAEAARNATAAPQQTAPQAAIVATATDVIGSDLYVLSAALVQPDFGTARISGRRAPVVVTGMKVDAPFLEAFQRRYMLSDAHLHSDDARFEAEQAHVGISNPEGVVVATVDWTPQQPGGALLRKFLPPTLILLVVMLAIALIAYRRAWAATRAVVASERHAVHVACRDTLTGLGNRHALEQRLIAQTTADGAVGSCAVHYVDLDEFKEVNDISGHAVGDELLRIVARRLRRLAGDADLCFRVGGDEFALIQPNANPTSAAAFADAIVQGMNRRFGLSIGRFQISASVGVAFLEAADEDASAVLRKVDLALFSAKREGRQRFAVYDPVMEEAMRRRRGLLDALRRDLQAGLLTMVYQPQVDRDRTLVGVEALVRWTSNEFGPVSPAVFVPLAEESGMIEALEAFTLKQAFQDSLRWPSLKTAVNVSAVQLRDPGFTDRIIALARIMGVRPSNIELELTEGVLVDRGQNAANQLHALRAAGFSLAIDDFGTGYSSLSYLSRFPIQKIKIDRSFVIEMGRSRSADVLVSSIVHLGRSLDMRVIAEGVETPEQWLRLASAGCNEFQGYLTSRPVTADCIERLCAGEPGAVQPQDPRFTPSWKRLAA
jgi:diguanylate cyclase (GGDEF)-like protein